MCRGPVCEGERTGQQRKAWEKGNERKVMERRSGGGWAEDREELCLGTQCERTSDRKHQEEEFQNEGLSVKNTKYTETSSIVLMPPKTKTFMFASDAGQCHKLINKSYLINGNQFSKGISLLIFLKCTEWWQNNQQFSHHVTMFSANSSWSSTWNDETANFLPLTNQFTNK